MRRVGISIAVAGLALAAAVPSASATANRPEYQAQVNEICANANREQERIIGVLIRKLKRAEKKDGGSGEVIFFTQPAAEVAAKKKKGKPNDRRDPISDLFRHFNLLILAVEDSELASLRQIAPAPGDEALVADWLNSRQLQNELYRESLRIESRIEKLFRANPRSRKEVLALLKKLEKLERRYEKIFVEAAAAYETDIEVGARLGASYCITDASGPTS